MKYSLWQILQLPKLQLPFHFSLETILGDIFSIGVIGWFPGYKMWPKSACDFLAPLLLSRNRRFAEGILITRKPIPCSIESGPTSYPLALCWFIDIVYHCAVWPSAPWSIFSSVRCRCRFCALPAPKYLDYAIFFLNLLNLVLILNKLWISGKGTWRKG